MTTAVILCSIFWWDLFPACFDEQSGLTPFKVTSEYVIIVTLCVAGLLIWRRRKSFGEGVVPFLLASIVLTILSEFSFTLYDDPYAIMNMIGHLLKVASFLLLYRGLIVEGLERPLDVLGRRLREQSDKYAGILETAIDGFVMVDMGGRILDVNEAASFILGYPRHELIGMRVHDIEGRESSEETSRHINEIKKIGYDRFETLHRRRDGSLIEIELSCSYMDHAGGSIIAFVRDISERKRAEAVLRTQAALLDQVSDAIVSTDLGLRVTSWNAAAQRIYGWSAEEAVGKHLDGLLQTQWGSQSLDGARTILEKTGHWNGEILQRDKAGKDLNIEASVSWLRDSGGSISGGVTVNRDVTLRRTYEEELRKSEEKYRNIVETAQEGIWMLDGQGETTFLNGKMSELLGYTKEEVLGHSFLEFMDAGEVPEAEVYFERRRRGIREQHDFRFRRKDGTALWAIVNTNPVLDDKGSLQGVLGMLTDITARKAAEEEATRLHSELLRRERILSGISEIADFELKRRTWEGVEDSLRYIGEAADVQRVYIFENQRDHLGRILTSQRHEWAHRDVSPQIANTKLQRIAYDEQSYGRWRRELEAGRTIASPVRLLPPEERHLVSDQGVLSIAVVPIHVEGKWWGFIGFDDCRREREWNESELDALKVAARLYAAFVLRMEQTQALVHSEARYRSIVQAMPDLLFRIDSNMCFVDVQTSTPELLLAPIDEIVGKRAEELLPPHLVGLTREKYRATIDSGEVQLYDYALNVGSETMEFESRMVPCGKNEVLAIVRDVTQIRSSARKLKESESRYNAVVNDQTELICRFNVSGILAFMNNAFCRFFGKREEELLGSSFFCLMPEEDRDFVMRQIGALNASNPIMNYQHRSRLGSGVVRLLEWTHRAILKSDGTVDGYQSVGRDVTKRKELERRLMDSSEREQKRLAQELHDGLCQDLKGLELETAFLDDMLTHTDPTAAARAASVGRQANLAVRKAYEIARGLLPVGLDAKSFSAAVYRSCLENSRQPDLDIRAFFDDGLEPVDEVHAHHLYRIFQEALNNSLRHGQATKIEVSWGTVGGWLVFSVKDNGQGFNMDDLDRIEGGIGMTVMRSRAQAIGAYFHIRSLPGEGTEVRCLLGGGDAGQVVHAESGWEQ